MFFFKSVIYSFLFSSAFFAMISAMSGPLATLVSLEDGTSIKHCKLPKSACWQGDQIGRIFTYWVIVSIGSFLKTT
jgi:hypothetical protein